MKLRCALALLVAGLVTWQTRGQDAAPPAATVIAATVNGQKVTELAVFRALSKMNPKNRELARKEIVNYLVDNVLIDQYLLQLKIGVDAKELDDKVQQIKTEANKKDADGFDKILKSLVLSEDELRKEMACALRWDRFVIQQATDKALKELFDRNLNMFDGTQMQARHILIKDASATPDQVRTRLAQVKKQIEDEVAAELAKLPAASKTEKERSKLLEGAFAKQAAKESACPSKENGGDLGWFPRAGAMVEPFARAAFALKPYQLSEPVPTDFGYHLILATDLKPGKDVKFEEVKGYVQEVYSERLREAVIAAMRPQSKIVVGEGSK